MSTSNLNYFLLILLPINIYYYKLSDSRIQALITLITGLVFISVLNYYLELSKYPKAKPVLTNSIKFVSHHECLTEWVVLNDDTFFKRNLAFYYTDLKLVKLYLERRFSVFYRFNVTIRINLKFKNSFARRMILSSVVHKIIQQHESYSFESVEAQLELKDSLDTLELFQAVISDRKYTSEPIDLIRKTFHNKQNKQNALICSKLYRYFPLDSLKQLEWWIELNKLNGFNKIVIYNSFVNYPELGSLISKYAGFIELRNFNCIPNLVENDKKNISFFRNFDQIRRVYKKYDVLYSDHFDSIVFHECFLENMDKFEFITRYDYEETLMPRHLKENFDMYSIANASEFIAKYQSQCYYSETNSSSAPISNIYYYLDSIKADLSEKFNFHFNICTYLKIISIESIFQNLNKLLAQIDKLGLDKSKVYSFKSREIPDKALQFHNDRMYDFRITINGLNEYFYAKNLSQFYAKFVKPFRESNMDIFFQTNEATNRLFYLTDPNSIKNSGRILIVASNLDINKISPLYLKTKQVSFQDGFVSHFRKSYALSFSEISILNFHFDFNYFACYYLPMLKKFNFNPKI